MARKKHVLDRFADRLRLEMLRFEAMSESVVVYNTGNGKRARYAKPPITDSVALAISEALRVCIEAARSAASPHPRRKKVSRRVQKRRQRGS